MSSMSLAQHAPSLRAINYRISSTPTKQLPYVAAQLAATLWSVRDVLSASQETLKGNAEVSTAAHRFRTSLSALLQDRTIEGRWAAVVLTKAAIEAGGAEVLARSSPWVKNLLAILKKPDPPSTRILTVILLTRIFTLTWHTSNLVREITTPALPTFIASCLSNIQNERCSTEERQTVLEAFATLISEHPTIFRTYESQLQKSLAAMLSQTSSDNTGALHYTEDDIKIARRLYVLLHHCAPKQSGAERWEQIFNLTVAAAHETCDILFRSVVEDPISNIDAARIDHIGDRQHKRMNETFLGFGDWGGVYAGAERLINLLALLKSHLEVPTTAAVNFSVGHMLGLVNRSLRVTGPVPGVPNSLKINSEVARDEREAMFSTLPDIHIAALQLIGAMILRFDIAILPAVNEFTELIIHTFNAGRSNATVRAAVYKTLRSVLEIAGPSISKEDVADISPIVRACCHDLLPTDGPADVRAKVNGSVERQQPSRAELRVDSSRLPAHSDAAGRDQGAAANALLPLLFHKINQTHLPRKVRVQMERTAVLAKHEEALVACVMNPAGKDGQATLEPSLVPLLARLCPERLEVEALLRPRMPVVVSGNSGPNGIGSESSLDPEADMGTEFGDGKDDGILDGHIETQFVRNHSTPADENGAASILSNTKEEEDLYSSTPQPLSGWKPNEGNGGAISDQAVKRHATDSMDRELSVKRLRTSGMEEILQSEHDSNLSTPQSAFESAAFSSVVTREQSLLPQQQVEAITHSVDIAIDPTGKWNEQTGADIGSNNAGESDESDFEIPEINPDPDTDPEEEEI